MSNCKRCGHLEQEIRRLREDVDLELMGTKRLADELIRRTQECIVIMLRPREVVDNRGSLAFYSSLDFDRLAHMCAITHVHLWNMANHGQDPAFVEYPEDD